MIMQRCRSCFHSYVSDGLSGIQLCPHCWHSTDAAIKAREHQRLAQMQMLKDLAKIKVAVPFPFANVEEPPKEVYEETEWDLL